MGRKKQNQIIALQLPGNSTGGKSDLSDEDRTSYKTKHPSDRSQLSGGWQRRMSKVSYPGGKGFIPVRVNLHDQIVKRIKEMIDSGQLAPGDRLLPERQLAEALGVSRTALREALAKMASMGFIEVRPKEGAYIKKISLDTLAEPLAAILLNEREYVSNLFEVRAILETKIVLLAAERAEPQDIALIKSNAYRVIKDIQVGGDSNESDTEFHLSLAKASHNELLHNIMSMLSGLMRETYGPARRSLLNNSDASLYGDVHLMICEAIENRRGEEAERLMKEHLELAKTKTMDFYNKMKLIEENEQSDSDKKIDR